MKIEQYNFTFSRTLSIFPDPIPFKLLIDNTSKPSYFIYIYLYDYDFANNVFQSVNFFVFKHVFHIMI